MASVTGKTSEKIDELFGDTLISGSLTDQGALILSKKDGTTINAGSVGGSIVGAVINSAKRLIFTTKQGGTIDAGSIETTKPINAWPVGSVFMSAVSTNPATLLGGGTWVRWGQGRVPISQDSTQSEFDAAEETGGSKTKTITEANLPAHTHPIDHDHANPTLAIRSGGSAGGTNTRVSDVGGVTGGGGDSDTATVNIANHTGASGSTGGGSPMDVLPPYITCYMWKRTA